MASDRHGRPMAELVKRAAAAEPHKAGRLLKPLTMLRRAWATPAHLKQDSGTARSAPLEHQEVCLPREQQPRP